MSDELRDSPSALLMALLHSMNDWLGNDEGLMIEDVIEWRDMLAAALLAAFPKKPNPCPVCGTYLWDDPRPCWNCKRLAASREPILSFPCLGCGHVYDRQELALACCVMDKAGVLRANVAASREPQPETACQVCGNEEHHARTGLLTCECPASPVPEGWQPIETAPQDKRWVLTWNVDAEYGIYRFGPGLIDSDDPQPTHWMSLPAPPVEAPPTPKDQP